MDLSLYGRVLWRFKWIVAAGFAMAALLSFVATFSISLSHGLKIHYREPRTWQGQATLLVSQRGFTYGRSVVPTEVPQAPTNGQPEKIVPKYGDESRFYGLSVLYAHLATSDAVMKLMDKSGPPVRPGTVGAVPVYSDPSNGTTLPLIQISGLSHQPAAALSLATRATKAFESYLTSHQALADIPGGQRVLVQEVNAPRVATLLAGPKKTIPVMIFIAILTIAVGLAFILENIRPRLREIPPFAESKDPVPDPAVAAARRARRSA